MIASDRIKIKTEEVVDELKRAGLWKAQAPAWVTDYEQKLIENQNDFVEWLQFVYLPNCGRNNNWISKKMIVPQVIKFFKEDIKRGKLLQLLIELDSLQ
jgi:uncharacterized protein YqcC (DUF446 family)